MVLRYKSRQQNKKHDRQEDFKLLSDGALSPEKYLLPLCTVKLYIHY
jgi:hypothetical protein